MYRSKQGSPPYAARGTHAVQPTTHCPEAFAIVARQVVLGNGYPYVREFLERIEHAPRGAGHSLEWCMDQLAALPEDLLRLLMAPERPAAIFDFADELGIGALLHQFDTGAPLETPPVRRWTGRDGEGVVLTTRLRLEDLRPAIMALYEDGFGGASGMKITLREVEGVSALDVTRRGLQLALRPSCLLLMEVAQPATAARTAEQRVTLAVVELQQHILFAPVKQLAHGMARIAWRPGDMFMDGVRDEAGQAWPNLLSWIRAQVGVRTP
ncbi:MAG: hypothetical protein NVSMB42_20670 [Herpetosiphon sp.]